MVNKNTRIRAGDTVGEVVACWPALAWVFEKAGIDYCCGGRKTLKDACREKGIDLDELINRLEEARVLEGKEDGDDAAAMSLAELADHIETTHHTYLRSELPRLDPMTEKVASAHGGKDPRLREVRETFRALATELTSHMKKEEQILFPIVRRLEAGESVQEVHGGSIRDTIRQMEHEHDRAGAALKRLRELTDGYAPPEWACNTYRALLDALSHLERDLHQHVHKENNVLFPRTITMERARAT